MVSLDAERETPSALYKAHMASPKWHRKTPENVADQEPDVNQHITSCIDREGIALFSVEA